METIITSKVIITTAIPMLTAVLIMLSKNKPNLREFWSIFGATLTFFSVCTYLPQILAGKSFEYTYFILYPGVNIKLHLDGLGIMFAGTASFLWILAGFYCIGYMRGLNEHAQTRFYASYALAVGGGMGVAFSGSLVTLYLFYEIVSIVTYPLVAHHQDEEGYDGARKYIVYLMFASKAFLLPAMILIYVQCGNLDFAAGVMKGIFPANASKTIVSIAYMLCLFGFAKGAIMPMHGWLPAAMVAPTPVSALLHAVVVVKVGVFSICRTFLSVFGVEILSKFGLGIITAYLASFTIIVASIIALTKSNLKARLAYSTISQLSYIILGVAMLTPNSITGGLIHIANHAFSKITLFFAAGAIYVATRKKDICELGGIGFRMPFTMIAFGLAALSMIGVPPVSGFVSKWYLALGAMDLKNNILLIVLLVSSLLNAGYFVPIFLTSFFNSEVNLNNEDTGILENRPLIAFMVVPLFISAVISVYFGFYPELFLKIIKVLVGS
ncbi:MAG: monovalent cation/H+ antiporter subunit D family protein [Desulfobacterales bacterium]|nr:monovalent cation/H+ antiporter subunit D family protein [Desulfobacterales bacterium]MBF0397933.1 monovalent cation/H+ antiporter subunit D family protein [Desulfobacterales bacterium]